MVLKIYVLIKKLKKKPQINEQTDYLPSYYLTEI